MSKVSESKRRALFKNMTDAWHKKNDYIEVTEWSNGEGWDVCINADNEGTQRFSLHFTEFRELKKLIKKLENGKQDL